MTKDLTEQWKNDELESGWYYIKNDTGDVYFDEYDSSVYNDFHESYGNWEQHLPDEIQEVLAPVPSYEEWQLMKAFCEEFNALDVAKENAKLKELLKDTRNVLKMVNTYCGDNDSINGFLILKKIDEVLNVAED